MLSAAHDGMGWDVEIPSLWRDIALARTISEHLLSADHAGELHCRFSVRIASRLLPRIAVCGPTNTRPLGIVGAIEVERVNTLKRDVPHS